ncbi:MAG TPA: hypothetical protein VJX23_02615 [Candidatus Binataceae bacterium]|nr:hypothetical protein [Candidatus Binataceae bacterium]
MDYSNNVEKAADRLLDGIRFYQEFTLDAVERAGKTIGGLMSAAPLPRPREVAESAFKVWGRFAENNREFTLKLLDALYPKSEKSN